MLVSSFYTAIYCGKNLNRDTTASNHGPNTHKPRRRKSRRAQVLRTDVPAASLSSIYAK